MKFSRFIAIAVAAIFCGGPLSVALADNLPTLERIVVPIQAQVRKAVPIPAQVRKVVTAQEKKVVSAPNRQHYHHYVEVPKYSLDCFGLFCLQKAVGYHRHYVQAHHDYDHDDN